MTEDAMIRLFEDHPNRMVMTVNAATGQVELAEDITLAEAKYCIDVLANHDPNGGKPTTSVVGGIAAASTGAGR